MIRVALVDDEPDAIEHLKVDIEKYFEKVNIDFEIYLFSSAEEFIISGGIYHLIFLDIQMDEINGLELAQIIRQHDYDTVLIFVTSYDEYVLKSMMVHPFSYIVKPYVTEEIHRNLDDYFKYVRKKSDIYKSEYFCAGKIRIRYDKILYFMCCGNRMIDVYTDNGKYRIKDSITNIYNSLNHSVFICPERGVIVNAHKVKQIDNKNKSLIMSDNNVIYIPRRRFTDVVNQLNNLTLDNEY